MSEITKYTGETPETSFDKILAFSRDYTGTVKLDKDLKEMLDRWNWADQQLRNGNSPTMVVGLLMKRYEVSRATGWRDIKNTQRLFGMMDSYDTEYDLALQRDAIQQDIKSARLKGDYASVARLQAVWEKIRTKVQDTTEADAPQPSIYVIELNTGTGEGKENKVIDITHLQNLPSQELKVIDDSVNIMGLAEEEMMKMLNDE